MIVEVKVPAVGESVTEGLLAAWLAQDGGYVDVGTELCELETDKVTMPVTAEAAGQLKILVPADSDVTVGQVLAQIDTDAARPAEAPAASAPSAAEPAAPASQAPQAESKAVPEPTKAVPAEPAPTLNAPAGMAQAQVKLEQASGYSPTMRRLIRERGIDPAQLAPTARPESLAVSPPPAPLELKPSDPRETRTKMTRLRQRLAERLVQVQQQAAILSTFNEVDMSAVMALRKKHQERFVAAHEVKLGFMSFFVKATVSALKAVPAMNSRIEGDEIVEQHFFDVGVAVSTEQGLVVPVLRDADKLSFAEVEQQIADYALRARQRRLTLEDLTGGCFTISNGGVFGSLLSTPIINPPQSGILGLHTIKQRPIAVGDEVAIRPMMYLAISYDHRLVDGAEAVTFLKTIVESIEEPERLLFEL